jgi:ABC-type methionine transport system permease subunit
MDNKDYVTTFNTAWGDVPSLIWPALRQTLEMVAITSVAVGVVGLTLGVVLHNTSSHVSAVFPKRSAYAVANGVVNIGRSMPFLILMAFLIPFTRLLVGTSVGIAAAVVPMSVAGIPWFARIVENALRNLPDDLVAASLAAGASPRQAILSAQVSEGLPALIGAFTIAVVGIVDFSALAGAIGAGGLGFLALDYGYNRFDSHVMLATVLTIVVLVQLIQFVGNRLAAATTKP